MYSSFVGPPFLFGAIITAIFYEIDPWSNLPWKLIVFCFYDETFCFLKIFRQNQSLVAKVVKNVTEKDPIPIDKEFALKIKIKIKFNKLFKLQWNAEIRTSLDFGRSTLVRFKIVRSWNNVWKPNDFVSVWSTSISSNIRISDVSTKLEHFI